MEMVTLEKRDLVQSKKDEMTEKGQFEAQTQCKMEEGYDGERNSIKKTTSYNRTAYEGQFVPLPPATPYSSFPCSHDCIICIVKTRA